MNRISELRKKLGLTQTRLGEEIGVSQQTISKYENVDENISGDMLLQRILFDAIICRIRKIKTSHF